MSEQTSPRPIFTEIIEECIGCKWSLHILGQVRAGVNRPGQLERSADGLTTNVLYQRLAKLVRYDILEKLTYEESPPRVEYRLTAFGSGLLDVLMQVERLHQKYTEAGA